MTQHINWCTFRCLLDFLKIEKEKIMYSGRLLRMGS